MARFHVSYDQTQKKKKKRNIRTDSQTDGKDVDPMQSPR